MASANKGNNICYLPMYEEKRRFAVYIIVYTNMMRLRAFSFAVVRDIVTLRLFDIFRATLMMILLL